MAELLDVRNLSKRFHVEGSFFRGRGFVQAVEEVSFQVEAGETVALVGESGSGKSTVAKLIQGLIEPDAGSILLEGRESALIPRRQRAGLVQTIFQDPFASLNPKLSVGFMLEEAIKHSQKSMPSAEIKKHARGLLESVGLSPDILHNYPHQFSGGQRQRLVVARTLAARPKLILADEPVSALDVSIQTQILKLLSDLKARFQISYLLITHDLAVVEEMAEKVLVMRQGRIVESGTVREVFERPKQPYTQELLNAARSTLLNI